MHRGDRPLLPDEARDQSSLMGVQLEEVPAQLRQPRMEIMCDYSLEAYRSRPAREGEQYVTHRFSSGTVGFIAPGDATTAVCMAYDTKLMLEDIPESTRTTLGIAANEVVTFARLDSDFFQDGVRFANGAQILLQRLGPGVKASVVDALVAPQKQQKSVTA
jgi:hypothetical protein